MKNLYLAALIGLLILGAGVLGYVLLSSNDESTPEGDPVSATADQQIIGYVGCSNTWQTIEGYHSAGGTQFWDADSRYGGGNVTAWYNELDDQGHWKLFDEHLADHPETSSVWWQLCIREDDPTPYEEPEAVLAGIRARLPDATIYVSPLAEFPDAVCGITGTFGVPRSVDLVAELLDKNPDLVAGPVLSPLTKDETLPDNCHIKPEARPAMGEEMKAFFD